MDEVQSVFDVQPSLFFVLLLPVCWPLSRGSHVEHVPVTRCDLSRLVLLPVWASPPLPEHTTLSAWKRCASCSTVSSLILCATATYWPRLYCTVIWFFVVLDSPRSLHQSPAQVSFKGWFLFFKKDCLHSWSLTCSVQWLFSLHALFLVLIIYIYLYLNSFFSLPLKGVFTDMNFFKDVTMPMWGVTMQRQSRHLQHLADTLIQCDLQ